jgi:YggT family protein
VALLADLLYLYITVLVVDALLSWFPADSQQMRAIKQTLRRLTDPVLAPVRRVLPSTGGIDFSTMIVIFVLLAVARAL